MHRDQCNDGIEWFYLSELAQIMARGVLDRMVRYMNKNVVGKGETWRGYLLRLQAEELASRNYLASLKRAEAVLAPVVERARRHFRDAPPMSLLPFGPRDR